MAPVHWEQLRTVDFRHHGTPHRQLGNLDFRHIYAHVPPLFLLLTPHNPAYRIC